MRILLDECIPRKFKYALKGHAALTVPDAGLAGKRNGQLLSLAEQLDFDVFLTVDKGVEYEQNLKGRNLGVLIIRSKSNRLGALLSYRDACLAALLSIKPGEVVRIGALLG